MKGYVATPEVVVDMMVSKLFQYGPPSPDCTVLDAGCGNGAFVEGIIRWCEKRHVAIPNIVGVELDSRHIPEVRMRFENYSSVRIEERDFLIPDENTYEYIIGNPPYVPITELSEQEKAHYRKSYETAKGRFDLYLLFFEQALRSLKLGGRLVFVTPEKFLYVDTAFPLRKLLSTNWLEEVRMLAEGVFRDLVTYPTITTITNGPGPRETNVVLRNGGTLHATFPTDGSSWLPVINGKEETKSKYKLADVCLRVSCGVATGADSVFVRKTNELDSVLRRFAYPTIAGRELKPKVRDLHTVHVMLIPYARDGHLMNPKELGGFLKHLSRPELRKRLEARTCVYVSHKPWYAFHENPPLAEILGPKILCKDITSRPQFWIDRRGTIVPRHSVYYIVPKDTKRIKELASYLNSETARSWLEANSRRAASSYLRLQSRVLKRLPVPERLVRSVASESTEVRKTKSYYGSLDTGTSDRRGTDPLG